MNIEYITFGSAAHFIIYEIGVIRALQEVYPKLHKKIKGIAGASVGGWLGVMYLQNIPADKMYRDWCEILDRQRNKGLIDSIKIGVECMDYFEKNIEVTKEIRSKIKLSLTEVHFSRIWCKNTTETKFTSKHQLIDCLHASAYVPFFMGNTLFKNWNDTKCLDGAMTNKLPLFDETKIHQTLIISTNSTDFATIKPSIRLKHRHKYIIPPQDYCDFMYDLGYNDAMKILRVQ